MRTLIATLRAPVIPWVTLAIISGAACSNERTANTRGTREEMMPSTPMTSAVTPLPSQPPLDDEDVSSATTDPVTPVQHVTVSCGDETHCHCMLGNATVAVQCRYGMKNVHLRWNILPSRPTPETKFEIDIQTHGTVKVLPSFLDLRLKLPAGQGPSVKFIIRDATLVDALYASDKTFTTEWHLNGVRVRSLNAEQLSPPPHPLRLTARHCQVETLRLPPLGPGARVTLDNCSVGEVAGLPSPPSQLPASEPSDVRPEVIVRKCRLHVLRSGAFSMQRTAGLSPASLLFDQCEIDEMERAAVSIPHHSCQLSFNRNKVQLLQREVFHAAGGSFRLTNNTLVVAHASALQGFCGHLSFVDNDIRGPLVYGALHFDKCVQYNLYGNVFQCPCDSVGWLGMFEQRQRLSQVEVFYERLYKSSLCQISEGFITMEEFARFEDCSGEVRRSNLMLVIVALVVIIALLLLMISVVACCHRRRIPQMTPVKRPRARNIYTSDISAPISKADHFSPGMRTRHPTLTASMSALSSLDTRPRFGQFLTSDSEDDDGLYATIVYKKRRAPAPPPDGSTPGPLPRRSAPASATLNPRLLNRCVSDGGFRLPNFTADDATNRKATATARKCEPTETRNGGIEPQPSLDIVEEPDDTYLVPDGSACEYLEVPMAVYDEIRTEMMSERRQPSGRRTHQMPDRNIDVYSGVTTRRNEPLPCLKKTSQDSGIGEDFCTEPLMFSATGAQKSTFSASAAQKSSFSASAAQTSAFPAPGPQQSTYSSVVSNNDVYSPQVKQRSPYITPTRT